MPDYTNVTGIDFIDVIIEGTTSQFSGSLELAILISAAFIVVALLMMGARREAVLMVPIPMFSAIALNLGDTFSWLNIVALMGMGAYTAIVLRGLFRKD